MKLLDLFCGAGGAGAGYSYAGFDVTGVDCFRQPNYPFEFIQTSAELVLDDLDYLRTFDAIHASPPCQAYSPLNSYNHKTYPDMIFEVREALIASGVSYVIENVVQAPLVEPTILCGSMFGGRYYRHRGFETSFDLAQPEHPKHVARCARNGYLPELGQNMSIHGGRHSKAWLAEAARVLGVEWMLEDKTHIATRSVCESIPPVYTQWVGLQLRRELEGR